MTQKIKQPCGQAVLYTMEHGITRAGNIFNAVPG